MRTAILSVFFAIVATGCGSDPTSGSYATDVIGGTVTMNGKPAEFEMIFAMGPSGQEVSGPRMAEGKYQIANPPKGMLKFRFAGGPVPGPAAPKSSIPQKYFSKDNELTFDFSGGAKTYNIELKN